MKMLNMILFVMLLLLIGCNEVKPEESIPKPVPVVVPEVPKVIEYVNIGQEFVKTAKSYGYVNETAGPNRSPEIDKFHDYAGLPYGNPWCAMFVNYVQYETLKPYNLRPYTKSARVSFILHYALKHKYQYNIKFAKSLMYGVDKAEAGDILIFISGASKQAKDNFNGHTGFILRETSSGHFRTIEGNTGPGNAGSQRDGDGVYERKRRIVLGSSFRIEALLKPIYPKVEK